MPLKRARTLVALWAVLCMLALAAACGGEDDDDLDDEGGDEPTAAATTPYKTSGNEGSISGTVAFAGTAPQKKAISMLQDPVCANTNPNATTEDLVVNGDKLQYVFVYVKDGKTAEGKPIGTLAFDAPAPPVLDQKGCQYTPHVVGVQARQKMNITNSDATSHNVNVDAKQNEKFNQGQGPGAPPIEKTFNRPETLIPVKCNQHPWMKAYIGVLAHPFFAVSGADGKFEIKGLPPGTYTVVAWHEKYPQGQTQSVTVGAKEIKEQNFSFTGDQLKAQGPEGGALEVMPALELPMLGVGHH